MNAHVNMGQVTKQGGLALLAFLVVVALALIFAPSADAQSGDIRATITIGTDSSGNRVGYARNSFGGISPDGFVSNQYSGSISQVVWDRNDEVLRVTFSADTSYPLATVNTRKSGGSNQSYSCETNTIRVYTCEHADDDAPWDSDDSTARVGFVFDDSSPDATPAPPPARDFSGLPGGYGPRASNRDIKLHSSNRSYEGITTDGNHLYIYDTSDRKVYGYDLQTRSHDATRDFADVLSAGYKGFAYADGYFWFIDDSGVNTSNKADLYRVEVTFSDDPDATEPISIDTRSVPMAGTNKNRWVAYHMEFRNSAFLVRYKYRPSGSSSDKYYYGEWFPVGGTIQSGDEAYHATEVETPSNSDGTNWFATDGDERIWYRVINILNPDDGQSDGHGAGGHDLTQILEDGTTNRQTWFDVLNIVDDDGDPEALFYHDNIMYMIETDTVPNPDETKLFAYQAAESAAAIVTDDTIGQYPPTLQLEVDNTYERGDAALVDVRMTWTHTSRADEGEGNVVMEYRISSRVTGMITPEDSIRRAYPTEHVIRGLPRENYNLTVEMRYLWYNNGTDKILIKNPPGVPDSVCESENDDEFTSALGNDDNIDATEDSDTRTPGCAFYLEPDTTRYSRWAETSINITGLLRDVEVPGEIEPVRHMSGLPGAVAEFMIVMGSDPQTVGPLARTMTIMGWMVLASTVAGVIYFGTGFRTGSMYLATLLWLLIWTGLGPFVAGVPDALAYVPAAVLLFAVAALILKRGRI